MENAEISHNTFYDVWKDNKAFIYKYLVSLSHNPDQDDDLLNETYLRAFSGFNGYRGGNIQAWLTTIARNVFYSHVRRKCYYYEQYPLTDDICGSNQEIGSNTHIDVISIRQALTSLPDELRKTILLRHYAGLSYEEIASITDCPVGTVKWRVHAASEKVRHYLGFQKTTMKTSCCEDASYCVLHYLYSLLDNRDARQFEKHLQKCVSCRTLVAEYQSIINALDLIEAERKMMHLIEIDKQGLVNLYLSWSRTNELDALQHTTHFYTTKKCSLFHWTTQEHDLKYKHWPDSEQPGMIHYEADLPSPIMPGKRSNQQIVLQMHPDEYSPKCIGKNRYRFEWDQKPSYNHEYVYILSIKIPKKATITRAEPQSQLVKTNSNTSPYWTSILAPSEQFRCIIEYSL